MIKAEFSASRLQCHMILQNHSNMLICCSWLLSMLKTVVLLHIFVNWYILFSGLLIKRKFKRTTFIWNIEIFYNIINLFTVAFDQFSASLLNKKYLKNSNYFKPLTISVYVWQCFAMKISFKTLEWLKVKVLSSTFFDYLHSSWILVQSFTIFLFCLLQKVMLWFIIELVSVSQHLQLFIEECFEIAVEKISGKYTCKIKWTVPVVQYLMCVIQKP